ncbi:MAG: hypothetical protein JJU13_11490 [Balneolaceae bacterium]|nr:hypothetical protein [Balneolaceae bacterium]
MQPRKKQYTPKPSKSKYQPIQIFFLVMISFGVYQNAAGQTSTPISGINHTFQVSLLPGISSSDSYSTSKISFNIIGGNNGAFHGIEIGTMFNSNRYDISGLQLSGLANINKQQASGVLLGGALNYTHQFSSGFMIGGVSNISLNETSGVLFAGGLNFTNNQLSGLMLSGVTNISKEAHGVTISPVNISQNHTGMQFGVLNVTENQEGTQIGLINFVGNETESTIIGMMSFVKGGRNNMDLWVTETGFINGGVRIGTERIYNVISIGYNTFHGNHLWQTGIGIGYHHQLKESGTGIESDLIYYNVNHDGKWTTKMSNNIQWRIHYTRSINGNLSLFTGPNFNISVSDENLSASHIPYTVHDRSLGSNRLRLWIGWSLGFQLY